MEHAFGIREYVWDVVREGPAVIVGMDDIGVDAVTPYVVAEIVNNAGHNRLGRVARRSESQLERYVKVLVPECEAITHVQRERAVQGSKAERLRERIVIAMEERGIEWSR